MAHGNSDHKIEKSFGLGGPYRMPNTGIEPPPSVMNWFLDYFWSACYRNSICILNSTNLNNSNIASTVQRSTELVQSSIQYGLPFNAHCWATQIYIRQHHL